MFIKQFYTNCLSHAAYYIESNGKAVVIDPLADIEAYVEFANERNTAIEYILETHFHADFVSGHLQLAEKTGATIVFGDKAQPGYDVMYAKDHEQISLGDLTIEVLHTPGHTLESVVYLLKDEQGNDHAIFTGDTLFLGDVGRPDLSSGNLSSEELASYLYDSLQEKIMPLADNVIVYPGHGAGSACGKKLADATSSTLGEQKQTNYALKAANKETFIKEVTEGMKTPPAYFFSVAKTNQQGPNAIAESTPLLTASQVEVEQKNGAILLDSRDKETFIKGFIPGSINIGLDGRFAPWVGALIPPSTPLILMTNEEHLEETIVRLARVGYTNIVGFFKDGVSQWTQAGKRLDTISHQSVATTETTLIDVRSEEDYSAHHEDHAVNIPIEQIEQASSTLKEKDITLMCASGYRAVIAASLLKQKGVEKVAVTF